MANAIGSVVSNAVNAVTGSQSGTTLDDFLTHFSSSAGEWVKTPDPLTTFDVSFKFFPAAEAKDEDKSWLDNLTDSLVSSAKSLVKNAANNLTGGLLGSIMSQDVDVMKKHNEFGPGNKDDPHTFMEYLAAASLLAGKEDWVGESAGQNPGSPLELQLGLYTQEITVPNMKLNGAESKSQTLLGDFPINGTFVAPDNNVLNMKFVNTKVPLMERIFYPWMREVTLPYWAHEKQPYTTATITIDFSKHCDLKYVFTGCRPSQINMIQPSQQADNGGITREVAFMFDFMFINSTLKNIDSWQSKLLGSAGTLVNGAASMLNI